MKLDVRDLRKLFDKNLEIYKKGGKPKNLYFLCRHDMVIDDIISDWIEDNSIHYIQNAYPKVLWEENAQGILVETNPPVYVLSNGCQKNMTEPFVLFYKMLNYGRDTSGDQLIIDFISKEKAPNAQFEPFDLKNRMFTIAHGFKEGSANKTEPLRDDLLSLFDIYEVEMDLQSLLEHEYQKELKNIKRYGSNVTDNDEKRWLEQDKQMASYIQKLIDTGFNIPDCGVFLINALHGSYFDTFEEFKEHLRDNLIDDAAARKTGIIGTNDKINADFQAIIDWLK